MKEVALLSVLQGVAEFLPISSSGHLVLGKHFLGMGEVGMRLDIFLHVGTLVAVFAFYWAVVWRILREFDWVYMLKIVVSAIPAGIVGILFKDQLEAAFASPKMVGGALIFTGVVLTLTKFAGGNGKSKVEGGRWKVEQRNDKNSTVQPATCNLQPVLQPTTHNPQPTTSPTWWAAIWMGLAQAVAILPGVSRSGMTLAAARAAKVEPKKSAEFSFLMSAPPIAGAALLDVLKMFDSTVQPSTSNLQPVSETSWGLVIFGAILAAVVGYFSLKLLVRSLQGRWFWLFGPYCVAAGLLTLILV